ncbi:RNA polymerase sigma factor [Haloferula sargassicola]|uniref:Sigma-70 family RNA polymerase sigma factor n=1 Tax=Haloferula sargassicola TaxID=490096 RepID=A0ABP9UM28_9BACT
MDRCDRDLLREFAVKRDQEAFAALVARHHGLAFATAFRILGHRMDAEDAVQQAFTILARKASRCSEIEVLAAWLHRVVVHEAVRIRKKRSVRTMKERAAEQHHQTAAEGRDPAIDLAPALDEALNSLSRRDRTVLTLHFFEGKTFKAIAGQLGGTAGAWQKRSVRALGTLAKRLRQNGAPVTVTLLASVLAGARVEAAPPTAAVEFIARNAIQASSQASLGGFGKIALLMSMKTASVLTFAAGAMAAYGWKLATPPLERAVASATPSSAHPEGVVSPSIRGSQRTPAFSVDLVRQLMAKYEASRGQDTRIASHLRSLMFMAPPESFEEVLELLSASDHTGWYREVAAALFARWAEVDPERALARLGKSAEFAEEGYRAVLLTWLNMDEQRALSLLLKSRTGKDLEILSQFLDYQCERRPRDAARLVDRVADEWPEADRPLFEKVAKLWARSEPLEAGTWVASYPDDGVKNPLLRSIAVDVAKTRGFDGLAVADHIADPAERSRARNDAIYWWGTTSGGFSIAPDTNPVRNLSSGFPADWTDENITTFAQAFMVNFSKDLPKLVALGDGEHQETLIYQGSVRGAAWSNPAAAKESAERLPSDFSQSESGSETLTAYILRWSEMDPAGASTWLSQQPDSPNVSTMKKALAGRAEP